MVDGFSIVKWLLSALFVVVYITLAYVTLFVLA